MLKSLLLGAALAAVILIGGPIGRAAAMPPAVSIAGYRAASIATFTEVCFGCRPNNAWGSRQYWQWDHRPIWDDPWMVLRPNFWGSPEPHLVPADIWACKWHLPSWRDWRRHRRYCGAWYKARRAG